MMTLREAFLHKYPKAGRVLEYYFDANGVEPEWETLTKLRLSTFADYCRTVVAQSSARQYCAKLKATLSAYSEEVDLPKDWSKVLTLKEERIATIWLDEDDLAKLMKLEPATKTEKTVWAQFMIGCYTGARHSDFCFFDSTNIVDGMLCYVAQKTKAHTVVPLKPAIGELLMKADIVTQYADRTFNETIRELCRRAGITKAVKVFRSGQKMTGEKWEFVTSHTARRSFATNLYLRGADLYSISRMLGHSSVDMTAKNYICCGLRSLPPEVRGYFR